MKKTKCRQNTNKTCTLSLLQSADKTPTYKWNKNPIFFSRHTTKKKAQKNIFKNEKIDTHEGAVFFSIQRVPDFNGRK